MNKIQVYNLFRKKKNKHQKGLFLTFEGLDGSAKNTQVNKTAEYLRSQGYIVDIVSFPDYERTIGKVIASYLKGEYGDIYSVPHELICIAYAADRVRLKDDIQKKLNDGHIVLADRYTYSNLFSAGKMEKGKRNKFIKWVENMEFNELQVVKPDYNFYLHVHPSISIERINSRGKRDYQEGKEDIHENNDQLLYDVAETYLDFAKSKKDWVIIDQMENDKQKSIEEVSDLIKSQIDNILVNNKLT